MSPQIARAYSHVLPIFWPYLWLQLRWIFRRQDRELRTLLIAVTKWGHVHIVHTGDSWRAYRKPPATKPGWGDPIWESHIAPNMAGLLREPLPTGQHVLSGAAILPCLRGRCPEGAEGAEAHPDTS